MNYNGYNFDFECDKIESTDPTINPENDKVLDQKDYNVDKKKYQERFWYGSKPSDPENLNGYGVNNPWIAPISDADTLVTIYDRFLLSTQLQSVPLI